MSCSAALGETAPSALARCAGCDIEADGRFTVAENWTWWATGAELVPYCPPCADRAFGHRLTMMGDGTPVSRLSITPLVRPQNRPFSVVEELRETFVSV